MPFLSQAQQKSADSLVCYTSSIKTNKTIFSCEIMRIYLDRTSRLGGAGRMRPATFEWRATGMAATAIGMATATGLWQDWRRRLSFFLLSDYYLLLSFLSYCAALLPLHPSASSRHRKSSHLLRISYLLAFFLLALLKRSSQHRHKSRHEIYYTGQNTNAERRSHWMIFSLQHYLSSVALREEQTATAGQSSAQGAGWLRRKMCDGEQTGNNIFLWKAM